MNKKNVKQRLMSASLGIVTVLSTIGLTYHLPEVYAYRFDDPNGYNRYSTAIHNEKYNGRAKFSTVSYDLSEYIKKYVPLAEKPLHYITDQAKYELKKVHDKAISNIYDATSDDLGNAYMTFHNEGYIAIMNLSALYTRYLDVLKTNENSSIKADIAKDIENSISELNKAMDVGGLRMFYHIPEHLVDQVNLAYNNLSKAERLVNKNYLAEIINNIVTKASDYLLHDELITEREKAKKIEHLQNLVEEKLKMVDPKGTTSEVLAATTIIFNDFAKLKVDVDIDKAKNDINNDPSIKDEEKSKAKARLDALKDKIDGEIGIAADSEAIKDKLDAASVAIEKELSKISMENAVNKAVETLDNNREISEETKSRAKIKLNDILDSENKHLETIDNVNKIKEAKEKILIDINKIIKTIELDSKAKAVNDEIEKDSEIKDKEVAKEKIYDILDKEKEKLSSAEDTTSVIAIADTTKNKLDKKLSDIIVEENAESAKLNIEHSVNINDKASANAKIDKLASDIKAEIDIVTTAHAKELAKESKLIFYKEVKKNEVSELIDKAEKNIMKNDNIVDKQSAIKKLKSLKATIDNNIDASNTVEGVNNITSHATLDIHNEVVKLDLPSVLHAKKELLISYVKSKNKKVVNVAKSKSITDDRALGSNTDDTSKTEHGAVDNEADKKITVNKDKKIIDEIKPIGTNNLVYAGIGASILIVIVGIYMFFRHIAK